MSMFIMSLYSSLTMSSDITTQKKKIINISTFHIGPHHPITNPISSIFSTAKQKITQIPLIFLPIIQKPNTNSLDFPSQIQTTETLNRRRKKRRRRRRRRGGGGGGEEITSIAAADHEDARGGGDEAADEGAEGGVALVPVEGAALLDVAGVPVQSVAIVVSVAARHVPEHGADVPDEDDGGGRILLVTGGAGGGGGKSGCIIGGCGGGRSPVAGGAWRRKLGVSKRRKEKRCMWWDFRVGD
ncbi:hypothetical protein TIFTF001_022797 [Ficus carica]|uniref:Uncharacterized protein n=1 Tax=Ficus carica TaxID=3494 RepID=A0AA88ADC2_FICCA|nr:hypothetical protein TIFTF001_022797 [Ficus carica]